MVVSHSIVNIDVTKDHHTVHYCPLVDQGEKIYLREFQKEPRDQEDYKTNNKDSF